MAGAFVAYPEGRIPEAATVIAIPVAEIATAVDCPVTTLTTAAVDDPSIRIGIDLACRDQGQMLEGAMAQGDAKFTPRRMAQLSVEQL